MVVKTIFLGDVSNRHNIGMLEVTENDRVTSIYTIMDFSTGMSY